MFKDKRRRKRQQARREAVTLQRSVWMAGQLHWSVLHATDIGVGNGLREEIVVSLTTFAKRLDNVYLTIESLLRQSLKPDRVLLWVSEQEFVENDLPHVLHLQQRRGLEVIFCPEDLGPYKKFYYTLQRYPDSLMITVNDDILYPHDLVDQLYRGYRADPHSIVCHRAHGIRLTSDGKGRPYKQWEKPTRDPRASLLTFPTGVGGVLYFPGCLDEQVLDKSLFMSLCAGADDVWLKAMSLKQGRRCRKVEAPRDFWSRFLVVEGSQAYSLKRANKAAMDGNDSKIRAVFDHFDLWPRLSGMT